MGEKKNYYQLIPNKELKCVWMTAGMLSYKLCKYNLQCEKCPLDWELRNISSIPSIDLATLQECKNINTEEARPVPPREKEISEGDIFNKDLSCLNINGCLFYHPGHTWVKVERADEVCIGIDYFLGKMIGKVKVIVLPLSGRKFAQGENLCSIIQEKGILDIVSPVSGSVLSVNQELRDQPELITKDPLGDGFLLTLKPKNLQRDQKHLFFGEAALSWYQKELERFKTAVISEWSPDHNGVGITMQDGEIRLGDIGKIIAPERYVRLVSTFLRNGEKDLLRSK